MEFKVGTVFHGFTVDRVREDRKAGGEFIEMTHGKTGAKLCYSANSEENKHFSVAFKTTPQNSTGVFHILEHSVLCGSEKFPVKEPFVELMKSSMNTFLNAMTFPDKTMYPVSSRNTRDFLNLTEVYLDAVFAPAILTNKNIFLQEGRRLEIADGEPLFNGVVLNEMRGVMSEPDRKLDEMIGALLFPDNCYRFNAGGAPTEIPSLTYEEFVSTYRRFYHPSNSYFYLDGSIPEEETFSLIESYLEKFSPIEVTWDVDYQTPVSAVGKDVYAVDGDPAGRDLFAIAKIFTDYSTPEKTLAAYVLCDYLASSNESPLTRAVLESGLAENVTVSVEECFKQLYLLTVVRNTNEADSDKIKQVIEDTVARILKEGIPKDDLVASLNKAEFSFRQMREPKALYRNFRVLDSLLYGGDPMLTLDVDPVFKKLRDGLETDLYEMLLEELFADPSGRAEAHLIASDKCAEETARIEKQIARDAYGKLTDAEKRELERELEDFRKWQNTPDRPEDVAAIPHLSLSEVSAEPYRYSTDVSENDGATVLYHRAPTNGIVYFTFYAPLTQLSREELSIASFISSLYGQLPTSKRDAVSLQREIKTYLGDFSASVSVDSKLGATDICTPRLVFSTSTLEENLGHAESIVSEIMNETLFTDSGKIFEIAKQTDEANRQRNIASGHVLALSEAKASLSSECAAGEAVAGVSYQRFVRSLCTDFDSGYEKLLSVVGKLGASLSKENMIVSATAEEKPDLSIFISSFALGEKLPESASYECDIPARSAVKTPSQVSYAVSADSLDRCGTEYNGAFKVAANILELDYLWNMIRVRGGAYGAGFSIGMSGYMFAYSYRDPSPASSIEVYKGCADHIEKFADSGEDIVKYIISTVSEGDPLQTPRAEGATADALWFAGISHDARRKVRGEMLSTDAAGLRSFASVLRHMAERGTVGVVGAGVDDCPDVEVLEI
ncbi:MAG: insulinase family protein [Clostridia bacterium]|nr:insulinase family protein [Clostridia bacterium]